MTGYRFGTAIGGQWSSILERFTVAIGSLARAQERGAVVISANDGGSGASPIADFREDIDPSLYCNSSGPGSVTICGENGVFIQGVNLIQELEQVEQNLTKAQQDLSTLQVNQANSLTDVQNLQGQVNSVQNDVFGLVFQVGLNQVLFNVTLQALEAVQDQLLANQNLTNELGDIKAELATLKARFETIDPVCLNQRRRLAASNPCNGGGDDNNGVVNGDPTLFVAIGSAIGACVVAAVLATLVIVRRERMKTTKPRIVREIHSRMWNTGDVRISTDTRERDGEASMPPPPYPPSEERDSVRKSDTAPAAPWRLRRGMSTLSSVSSNLYSWAVKRGVLLKREDEGKSESGEQDVGAGRKSESSRESGKVTSQEQLFGRKRTQDSEMSEEKLEETIF